jgi:hypothetical protein
VLADLIAVLVTLLSAPIMRHMVFGAKAKAKAMTTALKRAVWLREWVAHVGVLRLVGKRRLALPIR